MDELKIFISHFTDSSSFTDFILWRTNIWHYHYPDW